MFAHLGVSTSLVPTTNNYNFVLESRDAWTQLVQFRAFILSLSASEISCSSISCSWSLIRKKFPSEIAIRYVGFLLKGTILARKHMLALFSSFFHFFRLVSCHVHVRWWIIFAFFRVHDEQHLQANISSRSRCIQWIVREQPWSFKWCTQSSCVRCFVSHLPNESWMFPN